MAANTAPIFTLTPTVGHGLLTGNIANTASDGAGSIGTTMTLLESAGANGSFFSRIRVQAVSSAAATSMTATVIRFYLSTQSSGSTTSANTWLIYELSVAALVADHSTNATNYYDVPLNFAVPSGLNLLASIHANLATNTSWQISVFGGDY
jgi:hypothetical protein